VPSLWSWLERTDEPFDLVAGMTITFEPLLYAGLRFARSRNIPFVVYPLTHLGAGRDPGNDALGRFYTMRHQIDLVRRSDAVVAQTPTERRFFLERGVDSDKVHAVGPGFDPPALLGGDAQAFRRRHALDHPIVCMLTKMSYDKGATHTVEAARRLWDQAREFHLVLAGDVLSPFKSFFDSLPADVKERILLLGPISEQEKKDLLAAGDVLVMPSRTDSFGIVYLEAWFYRKPVVGARTWGVMDLIEDQRDGLLVPFGDTQALGQAIAFLLDHPEEAAAMGRRGRKKAMAHHTWDVKYPRIRELYVRLASG
jgi:glycosyltransferase involved in cell wall biosynthesis